MIMAQGLTQDPATVNVAEECKLRPAAQLAQALNSKIPYNTHGAMTTGQAVPPAERLASWAGAVLRVDLQGMQEGRKVMRRMGVRVVRSHFTCWREGA